MCKISLTGGYCLKWIKKTNFSKKKEENDKTFLFDSV